MIIIIFMVKEVCYVIYKNGGFVNVKDVLIGFVVIVEFIQNYFEIENYIYIFSREENGIMYYMYVLKVIDFNINVGI